MREDDARSEQLYRILAENTTDLITLYDLTGRRVYASPSVQRVLGHVPEPPLASVHPEDRERADAAMQQLLAGTPTEATFRHAHADGSWRWLEASGCVVEYRGAPHVLIVSRDITERRRAADERSLVERRFRAFVDNATDGLLFFDAEGTIVDVNLRACQNLGYTREELIGKRPTEFSEYAAERMPSILKTLGADKLLTLQSKHRRKDGSLFPVEVRLRSFREQDRVYGIALVRDISEQLRAHRELEQLEEQFRQAQKMEAVGRLAGGVAHDFNNLLMVINTYAEMLDASLGEDAEAREMVAEISKAGSQAAMLTRQLLAFSRKQLLQPRVLDLNILVHDLAKMLQRLLGETIAMSVVLEGAGRVRLDPGLFEQALTNLAVNARDAMPRGGTITLETRDVEVTAADGRGMPPGSYVMVGVRDTGSGMEDAVRARVFEPFFTTKELGRGTGLGLAMVYGFVKQSGGHIEVDSAPGQGAWFKIYLPRVQGAIEQPAAANDELPTGSETVLLVEDEDTVRRVTRRALESLGYTVLEARDGNGARELAATHPGAIDVMLSDVVMPTMTGPEVAALVTGERSDVRVIFMSGYSQGTARLDASRAAFLQKPFRIGELAHKLREVLDR